MATGQAAEVQKDVVGVCTHQMKAELTGPEGKFDVQRAKQRRSQRSRVSIRDHSVTEALSLALTSHDSPVKEATSFCVPAFYKGRNEAPSGFCPYIVVFKTGAWISFPSFGFFPFYHMAIFLFSIYCFLRQCYHIHKRETAC